MRIDRAIEGGKVVRKAWWRLRGETQVEGLESGPQDARVDLGEEERDAAAVGRQDVPLLMVEPVEQALAA